MFTVGVERGGVVRCWSGGVEEPSGAVRVASWTLELIPISAGHNEVDAVGAVGRERGACRARGVS